MTTISWNELLDLLSPEIRESASRSFQTWLARGDGIAVYQNVALDSSGLGHKKFCSFGSPAAQLETDEPPQRLPDIGGSVNWAYQLVGVHRP